MHSAMLLPVLACLAPFAQAGASSAQVNPIEKVIEMLSELQQKVIKEGEVAQGVYDEFAEWCEEQSKNSQFEIKTSKAEADELTATIDMAVADDKAHDEKIEELSASITTDESDLKDATEIRDKEHADFAAEEGDLVDTVDTLERAIGIIEREMAKGGAALVQLQNARSIADGLRTLVEASAISNQDASR